MRRVGVTDLQLGDGPVVLDEASARYVGYVLRMRAGDPIEIFDDAGTCVQGVLRFVGGVPQVDDWARVDASETVTGEPADDDERSATQPVALVLAAALTKAARWEWMLEKAAELGVTRIIPVQSQRSVVVVPEAKVAKRVDRWQRMVREASRQCGRRDSATVEPPQSLAEALGSTHVSAGGWWCAEVPDAQWKSAKLDSSDLHSCGVLVGPEGGWTESERECLREQTQCLALGPRTLRAESACVAALVRLQYVREGW